MTKAEDLELEFYKNGSAESVLKRFSFSEKEEKLVRDAIRTARLANPRMKLIQEADELLKEVAKTREPITPTEKTEVSIEAIAQLELLRLGASNKQIKDSFDDKIPPIFAGQSKYKIMFVVVMLALLGSVQYFMAKNAADRSTEQAKSYENISMEFTGSPVKY